jgi:hypothetical protein
MPSGVRGEVLPLAEVVKGLRRSVRSVMVYAPEERSWLAWGQGC